MDSKEQAKDIYDYHYYCLLASNMDRTERVYFSQQCALITVAKLIKETGTKFWYEVEKEIESYDTKRKSTRVNT